jgi:signal transduction histidine kinase
MLRNERDVPDGMVIDHDDGNGLNNASYNHKMGTRGRNQRNVRKRIDNISGETGISWNDRRKIWEADVSIDGVRKRKSSKDRNKLSEWLSMTRKNSGEFSLRHGK